LLSFWTITFGQTFEVIEGDTLNRTDKNLLKQGFWYEYHTQRILTTDSFKKNPKAVGYHNDKGLVYTPIAEGFYKDNKRVGNWTYYEGFYNDLHAHLKTVAYTDSGYRYEIDSFYHYIFKVSNDTTSLKGKLFLKNDTVEVVCKDGKCKLYNPFRKKTEIFKWKELCEYIRYFNFYSFEVKKKKNGS